MTVESVTAATRAKEVMDLIQKALALAPAAGLYLKIRVEAAKEPRK